MRPIFSFYSGKFFPVEVSMISDTLGTVNGKSVPFALLGKTSGHYFSCLYLEDARIPPDLTKLLN
jgi:hypothetical protein